MIIVVSGLPRSGTSMLMQMLRAGGVPVLADSLRVPDEDNPRGYFEDQRVKSLRADSTWIAEAEGKAVKVVSQLIPSLPSGHAYRVIFVERDLAEVVRSQQAMLDRLGQQGAGVAPEKLAEVFERHVRQVREWMAARPDFHVLYLSHREVMANPLAAVKRVANFIGGDLDLRAMAAVVDPLLYRHRA